MNCCAINNEGEESEMVDRVVKVAKGAHRTPCCECREPIALGTEFELYTVASDGSISTYKTCILCVEIRDHFSCGGWIFEEVWADLQSNLFETMTAGGPCMVGLSPAAKRKLLDACLAWRLEQERDGARPPGPNDKVSERACSHTKTNVEDGYGQYVNPSTWDHVKSASREICVDCGAFRGLNGIGHELHDNWIPKDHRYEVRREGNWWFR